MRPSLVNLLRQQCWQAFSQELVLHFLHRPAPLCSRSLDPNSCYSEQVHRSCLISLSCHSTLKTWSKYLRRMKTSGDSRYFHNCCDLQALNDFTTTIVDEEEDFIGGTMPNCTNVTNPEILDAFVLILAIHCWSAYYKVERAVQP